ncbi:MAG: hypothetical protein MSS60_00250 [Clostridiales bacterium]|nr:hypothetical protein [Clostridiales bacterium]
MSGIKMDGLDDLKRELSRIQKNARELDGKREIPFDQLFSRAFMRKYTRFASIDELLEAGGFHAHTNDEFESIPENELDTHIAKCTKFKSWEAMLQEATEQYVLSKLGF